MKIHSVAVEVFASFTVWNTYAGVKIYHTHIGELLTGNLLTYSALTMEFRKVPLPKDISGCAVCGDHTTITELKDSNYEPPECHI